MNLYRTFDQRMKIATWVVLTTVGVISVLGGMLRGTEPEYKHDHQYEPYEPEHVNAKTYKALRNIPYKDAFRRSAATIHVDWEIMAAIAYHESRFNPNVVSPFGACGIMQIMPKPAYKFGLNDSTIFVPEENIAAAAQLIKRLQRFYTCVKDSSEQIKFVLASYNAGPAHVLDAQNLTEKYGEDPSKWSNVEKYLSLLNQEEYYNDSVVKYGSFQAGQTIKYVHGVMHTSQIIKNNELKQKHR